ncbi:unnamed protein product [Closterium sp. NIES-64]|nr:unnamed protein product [Closterium sp. NIES-64]
MSAEMCKCTSCSTERPKAAASRDAAALGQNRWVYSGESKPKAAATLVAAPWGLNRWVHGAETRSKAAASRDAAPFGLRWWVYSGESKAKAVASTVAAALGQNRPKVAASRVAAALGLNRWVYSGESKPKAAATLVVAAWGLNRWRHGAETRSKAAASTVAAALGQNRPKAAASRVAAALGLNRWVYSGESKPKAAATLVVAAWGLNKWGMLKPGPRQQHPRLLLPWDRTARCFLLVALSAAPPLPSAPFPPRRACIALPSPRALRFVEQRALLPPLRRTLPLPNPPSPPSPSSSFLSSSAATRPCLWRALPTNPPLHHPPPLLSPSNSPSARFPPPLFSPHLLQLLAPDGSAVNFPSWLNCLERTPSGTLVSGFNLWFVTQQSGSGAIPKPASAPTSTSSDPYADGLRAAIAETERIAATAQASAAAALDNAAARDLARILAESLESTRKCLTEHLSAPSPRSASTPSAFAPSHSDLLTDWHVANAIAYQIILACLPPALLPQCSHIRYAKDLLGYLTERFQLQTPISVIALLRELTSLCLADFTTMADYIARVQTLSSQLASQKFELSDHVCGALLLTGLTPEYSVHVTLYASAAPPSDIILLRI